MGTCQWSDDTEAEEWPCPPTLRTLEGEGRHDKEADELVTTATWPLDWRALFLLSHSFHVEGAQLICILAFLSLFTLSAQGKRGADLFSWCFEENAWGMLAQLLRFFFPSVKGQTDCKEPKLPPAHL